jgi:mono/diheme cytochrome c family protein
VGALIVAAHPGRGFAEPQPAPGVDRGAEVARARCASCHAVALEPRSPNREAPLFRVLSRLYSAEDLRRKLEQFSETGHFDMPPVSLREDEIEDVAAYIASLEGGATNGGDAPRKSPCAAGGRPAASASASCHGL